MIEPLDIKLLNEAAELLRGIQELFDAQHKSPFVLNLLEQNHSCFGGGDGYAMDECIQLWLEDYESLMR